jgi:hypothetical protein
MPLGADLNSLFPGRVLTPMGIHAIPSGHLVYILAKNDAARAIVAGKQSPANPSRSRVIFDDIHRTTTHFKAMLVRLNHLFNPPDTVYSRFIITCDNAEEAKVTEKTVHKHFNGDDPSIPPAFREAVLRGFPSYSVPWTTLCFAMSSAYDGISDLQKWRRLKLIDDLDWRLVSDRLQLDRIR